MNTDSAKAIFSYNTSEQLASLQKTINFNLLKNKLGKFVLYFLALIFFSLFFGLIFFIIFKGGHYTFSPHYWFSAPQGGMHDEGGILYPLIGTVYVILASILCATPIGICAGVYLAEYAKQDKGIVKVARLAIQGLAGIPSIIFGLFGLAFFVLFLNMKHSLLAASFSIAIMILPFIITTTEEAIKSIPHTFREASVALGATKAETILRVIIPTAMPNIFTGIMLGIGRAVAESAILILAAGGSITALPRLFSGEYPFAIPDSGRTLAVHLYYQATSYNNTEKAYATAAILIILVLLLNTITFVFFKRKAIKFNK